ncbi:N-acetymuramyl-L-alanine amidase-related protein [Streptomyces himastatinicus ATCC 53653]|uniref:N-acetymuramyl-L-alanine amidase-related protein n=1 Tax=Streptomyces himastatinicus ATCC 53653 TaxID=457427 RepID=D9WWC9_9ACTN|nr:N-acetymuramyl-L-alanine amidase-related protein [Streptomyces himastatinicus ATCC 53653]
MTRSRYHRRRVQRQLLLRPRPPTRRHPRPRAGHPGTARSRRLAAVGQPGAAGRQRRRRTGILPADRLVHLLAAARAASVVLAQKQRRRQTPFTGKVVVLDPGHNPNNRDHTAEISRHVDIGTDEKECDTTGTATDAGYSEASFTLDVARHARALLEARGATVKFTQDGDRAFGPCVDERARIGNSAHADAVVSVHADGAPAGDRGFHVILPKSVRGGDADTSKIAAPSRRLGERVRGEFMDATHSEPADYIGDGSGLNVRGDLGGLNLSTVPKVFIECGNMRDSKDAAELTDPKWRERAALGIAQGITDFLNG